ncbi:MAG: glycosyltransferase, partial [Crocinitomicaceae bacterium]|nr:glycosyltransferase [Crocinitomicaceae bacterium]
MKILYFANPSSPHDAKWINLIAKNHDVLIISQTDLEDTVYCDTDITIHQLLPQFQILKHNRSRTIHKIDAIIELFKPDIIHSMYVIPNSFWACDSKKNIPHVITTRGSDILVEYPNNYIGIESRKKLLIHSLLNRKGRNALARSTKITRTSAAQIN